MQPSPIEIYYARLLGRTLTDLIEWVIDQVKRFRLEFYKEPMMYFFYEKLASDSKLLSAGFELREMWQKGEISVFDERYWMLQNLLFEKMYLSAEERTIKNSEILNSVIIYFQFLDFLQSYNVDDADIS